MSSEDGYVAMETLFLNFNIISLTFRNDRGDTVIAVVSDPQNIINGVEPPPGLGDKEPNWLMIILGIVGLILFLLIAGPILSPIITFLLTLFWEVIATLFKLIWSIIKFPFKVVGDLIAGKRE